MSAGCEKDRKEARKARPYSDRTAVWVTNLSLNKIGKSDVSSLRNRLILSHILPALLIIPLMGVAMAYGTGNTFPAPQSV